MQKTRVQKSHATVPLKQHSFLTLFPDLAGAAYPESGPCSL